MRLKQNSIMFVALKVKHFVNPTKKNKSAKCLTFDVNIINKHKENK